VPQRSPCLEWGQVNHQEATPAQELKAQLHRNQRNSEKKPVCEHTGTILLGNKHMKSIIAVCMTHRDYKMGERQSSDH